MYKKIICLFAILHVIRCDVAPLKRFYSPTPIRDTLNNGRIISGNNAATGQFPWQVVVEGRVTGFVSYCGGSLITANSVLTAAHCCADFTSFIIQFGSIYINSPLITRNVDKSKVVIHPKYNLSTMNYDAAIIKLDQDVSFSSTIQTIALPRLSDAVENYFYDNKITVSGWGRTENDAQPSQLKYTDMMVIKNSDCKLYFGSAIVDSTICAKGTQNGLNGPCNGDSGGPAVIYQNNTWTLIGIVSFSTTAGCQSGVPAGFMNVSFLLNWISANTGVPIATFM